MSEVETIIYPQPAVVEIISGGGSGGISTPTTTTTGNLVTWGDNDGDSLGQGVPLSSLATSEQGELADTSLQPEDVVADTSDTEGSHLINVDWFNANLPAISGNVDSVNGETGVVVLTSDNISDASSVNKYVTQEEKELIGKVDVTGFKTVSTKDDLPTPVGNVITLNGGTWFITDEVDLQGDRIVCSGNTSIRGASQSNAVLKSTGLALGQSLISTQYSLGMDNINIEVNSGATVFTLDAIDGNRAVILNAVTFQNCNDIGFINNYNNSIFRNSALLNSANLNFDGLCGTIAFEGCFFVPYTGEPCITIMSSCEIQRRFRIIYSSFIVNGFSTVGIDVDAVADIPAEGYILDTVNFSGTGVYTQGVQYNDDKALFSNCRGVTNSASVAFAWFQGNSTATNIVTQNVPAKAVGNFTLSDVTQRFSSTTNTITYNGSRSNLFKGDVVLTLSSVSNQSLSAYVAINDVIIPASRSRAVTSQAGGSTKVENMFCQAIGELNQGDTVSVWVENNSSSQDIVVENCSLTIRGLM